MTTVRNEEQICAMCGAKSTHMGITSTNAFGSPDLDLRPPDMERSTMGSWVQQCGDCGYAYRAIKEKAPKANTTVTSDAYKAIVSSSLSATFLKASLISEGASDPDAAANYALYAAWAADDSGDKDEAISYRNRVAELFVMSLKGVDESSEQSMVTRTKMVDVLRRAERWTEATDLAKSLLEMDLPATIRAVLEFQTLAASQKDGRCYTTKEALDDG